MVKFFSIVLGLFLAFTSSTLAEVLAWECNFTYRIAEDGRSDERLPLVFRIDTLSERAFMEGNIGIVDVDIHIGDAAFTFIEKPASGIVHTTTVTRDGLAVHSRNTVILGEIVAAQHFGTCFPQ